MINALFEMLIRRSRLTPEPSDSSSSGGSVIPTDYAFYASLKDRSATSESGHTLTYSTSNLQPAVVDGIPCMNFLRSATGSGTACINTDFNLVSDTKPFTISCWMWLYDNSYDSGLWSVNTLGFRCSVLMANYDNTLHTTIYESPLTGRIFSSEAPSLKTWHLVVFTGDGNGTCTLYIDNVNMGTATYDGYTQNYNLILGKAINGSFNGYLCGYRFYRRALTEDELTALYNEDLTGGGSDSSSSGGADPSDSSSSGGSGIPTDYVFRAPLANDLNDVSASARTGTLTGTDTASVVVGDVKDGVACTYIPQSVRLFYPLGDVNVGSSPRTVSLWFWSPCTRTSWNTIFCYGTNAAYYYLYAMGYHQSYHYAFTSWWNDLDSGLGTVTSGTWHNFVTMYDGTDIKVYVDGVLAGSKTTANINTATGDIYIGGRTYGTGDNAESMWYADVRIYNRALTDDEVAALATSINPDIDTSDSSSTGGSDSSSSGGITPVIPTDYIRRYELTSNLKDSKHSTNTDYDLTKPSYASTSYGTEDGITGCKVTGTCIYNLTSTGLSTTNGYALSFWAKCASTPASSTNAKCMVNLSQYWSSSSIYWIGYVNGKWAGGASSSSLSQIRSDVAVDASWHCLTLNFDKTGQTISLWVDGVKAGELAGVSSLSISYKGVVLNAGAATQGTTTEAQPDVTVRYRDVTIFAKTLTEAEILGLAQEH